MHGSTRLSETVDGRLISLFDRLFFQLKGAVVSLNFSKVRKAVD